MFSRVLKRLFAVSLLVFSSLFFSPEAAAIGKNKIDLQIAPAVEKITLTPGASFSGSYKVMNIGYQKFSYKLYATPYRVIDEKYTPDYTKSSSYNQISDWISLSRTSGTLEPDEQDTITYTVNVPKDVPEGGQYAVLMAETSDGNTPGATVGTVTRVGLKLYGRIEGGKTRECGKILDNKIDGFLFEPPIKASSLIENCGNIDVDAKYSLKVAPFYSNQPIFTSEEKPDTATILPETRRFNVTKWDHSPQIGIFKVEHTVTVFGQTSRLEQLVFVIPLWLVILIIIFLLAVGFWQASRHRQRRERRLAEKMHQA